MGGFARKEVIERLIMTSYETEEDYVKDQLKSYQKAKQILRDYKLKIKNDLLIDYRGDLDKVLEGIDEGIKYTEKKRKEFLSYSRRKEKHSFY